MFEIDSYSWQSNVIVAIALAMITLMIYYVKKNGKSIRHRIFAASYIQLSDIYNRDLDAVKTELFSDLKNFEQRDKGRIKILEIGVGPGANFKFYPRNSSLIAVDPNPHFQEHLKGNADKFSEVDLQQFILGEGEDLAEVEDGSVDVVITTIVLCSVRDVEKVLKEIRRVLAQGGKYFFLEHVLAQPGTSYRRWQSLLEPIWPVLYDGCHLTRDIGQMIAKAGFSKTDIKHFIAPLTIVVKHIIGPHICGIAHK